MAIRLNGLPLFPWAEPHPIRIGPSRRLRGRGPHPGGRPATATGVVRSARSPRHSTPLRSTPQSTLPLPCSSVFDHTLIAIAAAANRSLNHPLKPSNPRLKILDSIPPRSCTPTPRVPTGRTLLQTRRAAAPRDSSIRQQQARNRRPRPKTPRPAARRRRNQLRSADHSRSTEVPLAAASRP